MATYFPKGLWSGLPSEVMVSHLTTSKLIFLVFICFIVLYFVFHYLYTKDTENHVTQSWILVVPSVFLETVAELQAVGAAFQIVPLVRL